MNHVRFILFKSISRTGLRVSNANQSPVPIGNRPIELHLYNPKASVSMLARIYTIFWRNSVLNDLEEEDDDGANGANAVWGIGCVSGLRGRVLSRLEWGGMRTGVDSGCVFERAKH